jgi:hypothetical protein
MKISIMQPYFFPYLGYFSLIKHTDQFILLDTVQFIRHGWIERNRILRQGNGWIYFQVPIIKENGRGTLIKNIIIDNKQSWKQKILSKLQYYKKIAPNYYKVVKILNELFNNEFNSIVTLNWAALKIVCDYLEFNANIQVFSEMGLEIERPNAPDEWALNICNAIGSIDEYWNPLGGISFFDNSKYIKSGLVLKFHEPILVQYNQKREVFEGGLSIIDVMMFNSVKEIHDMIDNFELK